MSKDKKVAQFTSRNTRCWSTKAVPSKGFRWPTAPLVPTRHNQSCWERKFGDQKPFTVLTGNMPLDLSSNQISHWHRVSAQQTVVLLLVTTIKALLLLHKNKNYDFVGFWVIMSFVK